MRVDVHLRKNLSVYVDMYFCVLVYVNGMNMFLMGTKEPRTVICISKVSLIQKD